MSESPTRRVKVLQSRRKSPRVTGPFEGRRQGALAVDVRIHDLSVGGCLIESLHEVQPGRRMRLDINLPGQGYLTLDAEALYTRPDYGFAVKFINVPEETHRRLRQVIERLRQAARDKPTDL